VFADLLGHPGVEEVLELRSPFGFLAFHGGLEQATDTIAAAAAAQAGASLYAVIQPAELRWHVPSSEFDPDHSPALAAFLDHVEVAVALHGYGRRGWWTKLLAGGTNRELAADVRQHVHARLRDYEVVDDLASIPSALRGMHPRNPVNRPRDGGVQLELPPRVRGLGPYWDARPGEATPVRALVEALASMARPWARDTASITSTPRGHR
jgi:phage replication-related protein YjqB (UPF0714/DUF867 family)